MVAVLHVGGDQGGTIVGRLREHAQRLTEGDRGLVGHPGQLAAPHHADNRQTGSGIHLGRQPNRALRYPPLAPRPRSPHHARPRRAGRAAPDGPRRTGPRRTGPRRTGPRRTGPRRTGGRSGGKKGTLLYRRR
ncbi:hypothetical protein GCM10012279_04970 [Micromonospora yangpuensis]|nr:hypothetical protein GCM10012279_04970 [Micromonospora yangpuensis]